LQILFLNLVTDVFPALALGTGAPSPGIMKRRPRPATEPILTAAHWRSIVANGLVLTASALAANLASRHLLGADDDGAVTATFLTLALAQVWHVFNMRDQEAPALRNEVTRNPWVWGAIVLCLVLVLGATLVRPLATILSLAPLSSSQWALVFGMSFVPLVAGQVLIRVLPLRAGP
jgi:Ca2+-transporting ATPase